MRRTKEALVAEAERARKMQLQRVLARQGDIQAERKMREAIAANVRDRIDHLDSEALKNYQNEHTRIMSDMKALEPKSSGYVRMQMRADQLEKLAEMTLNKRPHPVFRQVKGSYKVIGGVPQDVKFQAPKVEEKDLDKALKDALNRESAMFLMDRIRMDREQEKAFKDFIEGAKISRAENKRMAEQKQVKVILDSLDNEKKMEIFNKLKSFTEEQKEERKMKKDEEEKEKASRREKAQKQAVSYLREMGY